MERDGLAPQGEHRRRLVALFEDGGTLESVAAALAEQPDVLSVSTRPGLVKTEPPLVELVIDWSEGAGQVRSRVYDIVVGLDGRLVLGGDHEA